jgi:hypothetical protein
VETVCQDDGLVVNGRFLNRKKNRKSKNRQITKIADRSFFAAIQFSDRRRGMATVLLSNKSSAVEKTRKSVSSKSDV